MVLCPCALINGPAGGKTLFPALALQQAATGSLVILCRTFPIHSPSVLKSFPVPTDEKCPHIMVLLLPFFTIGMVFYEAWTVLDLRHM